MIRYQLVCKCKNEFESWFRSSDDFEKQCGSGLLSCPGCGGTNVEKALMAPNVSTARKKAKVEKSLAADKAEQHMQKALREMRSQLTKESEYVGEKFVSVARKMHHGDEPERGIHGEAKLQDVQELNKEGINVLPLPTLPEDKN